MARYPRINLTLGWLALIFALLAYTLGSAPFTPAMVLLLLALPLALVTGLMGAWRLALVTVYFSTAAWFVIPLAKGLAFRIDYLLALMGLIGIILGGSLVYFYRRTSRIT